MDIAALLVAIAPFLNTGIFFILILIAWVAWKLYQKLTDIEKIIVGVVKDVGYHDKRIERLEEHFDELTKIST